MNNTFYPVQYLPPTNAGLGIDLPLWAVIAIAVGGGIILVLILIVSMSHCNVTDIYL